VPITEPFDGLSIVRRGEHELLVVVPPPCGTPGTTSGISGKVTFGSGVIGTIGSLVLSSGNVGSVAGEYVAYEKITTKAMAQSTIPIRIRLVLTDNKPRFDITYVTNKDI
jgi:hypothetical protein